MNSKELEKQSPGAVKILSEEYGIRNFYRFPLEVLLAQVSQEKEQIPYGLIIFPTDDNKLAFDELQPVLANLHKQLKGHHAIKIVESGSEIDLGKKFITLKNKYGEKNKISFVFLAGHGVEEGSGVILGNYDSKIPKEVNSSKRNVIWKEKVESPSFKKINQKYLDEDAEIVFLSCGTGVREGIADKFSSSFLRKTTAPVIAVILHNLNIKVSYDEEGKPHFKTIFQNEEALSSIYNNKPNS